MNSSLVDGFILNQTATTERNGLPAARKSRQIASVFLDKFVVQETNRTARLVIVAGHY
jgi:hypothetical protein